MRGGIFFAQWQRWRYNAWKNRNYPGRIAPKNRSEFYTRWTRDSTMAMRTAIAKGAYLGRQIGRELHKYPKYRPYTTNTILPGYDRRIPYPSRRQLAPSLRRTRYTSNRSKGNFRCWFCGRKGHIARFCPYR